MFANTESRMLVNNIPAGNTIVLNEVQLKKAPVSRVVKEDGKVIDPRDVLFAHALDPIVDKIESD